MLEVALYLYVQQGSGVVCIEGNSRGPRPRDPYATLLLTDDVDASHPSRMDLGDGTTLDTHYVRATYSLPVLPGGCSSYGASLRAVGPVGGGAVAGAYGLPRRLHR